MKLKDNKFRLSASDLSNFLSCNHLTELDVSLQQGKRDKPEWNDPHVEVLRERGFEHEASYIDHLKSKGLRVTDASDEEAGTAYEKTMKAMGSGADVIVQGTLILEQWFGRSDVLLKVDRPSKLGDYSYEVVDTKLSRDTKAGSILQLSLYSEMLAKIQGVMPEKMYIVIPGNEYIPQEYRVDDYMAYYRLVQNKLLELLSKYDQNIDLEGYPEPTSHCDICGWWKDCDKRRRADDHLSFVAGISKRQMEELKSIGVDTMEKFAGLSPGFEKELKQSSSETYLKSFNQARIQIEGRNKNENLYELLDVEDERGFNKLPEPTDDDIFFDIEGDTYVGDNGLEYLLGYSYLNKDELKYNFEWALNFEQEKKAFEWFIDLVIEKWKKNPGMHIYHYAPYEPGAIKRLMGKYGTREREVDSLLRAGKFIDLYSVVRQGLRASVESYSIKDLEIFYKYNRKIDLQKMSVSKRALEHSLELNEPDRITDLMKDEVKVYNQDDTDSTYYLRQWLEKLRAQAVKAGAKITRPELKDGDASDSITDEEQALLDLRDKLQEGIPVAREDRNDKEQGLWILSELISFFRRELKVAYWEKFRLMDLDWEELKEDRSGMAELKFIKELPLIGKSKIPTHRYKFTSQEIDIRLDDDIYNMGGQKLGKVVGINVDSRIVDIKKMGKTKNIHPFAVFKSKIIQADALAKSLYNFATNVSKNSNLEKFQACLDILYRDNPRLVSGSMKLEGEKLSEIKRIVSSLDNSYLPIQGPPGAGKSYTGSHVIADLIENGKKVGITAVSHKVINGLLESTIKVLSEKKIQTRVIKKENPTEDAPAFEQIKDTKDAIAITVSEPTVVVGGTSWLFSHPDILGELDYLVIDEAGQLSLANVMSVGGSAKNIILLGDPRQLEQPIQGSHPDGCAVSALEHILGEEQTVPEEQGVFLDNTYRLHPKICKFNSELFYESRLESIKGNEAQVIKGSKYENQSLVVEEVNHTGNQNSSIEEIEKIQEIVSDLLLKGSTYTRFNPKDGSTLTNQITEADLMIIAPYNAQVQRLKDSFPNIETGTVDKFQGREAPIVIYSMTTSAPEDAPRGMEFLYSLNRLNVAVSRAECLFVLVASPKIFEPECRSPRQMQLANALCRYREIASSS